MKKFLSYFLICLCILSSCSPKMTTTLIKAQAPLEDDVEVKVLPPEAQEPEHAIPLQTIKLVGDDYDELIEMAKDQARQAGGNVLQIVKHLSPDISSPKHRAAAMVLSTEESILADAGTNRYDRDRLGGELSLKGLSQSLRIAIQGGGAYKIGKMEPGLEPVMEQHQKNLRFGWLYGADVSYFLSDNMGIGFKFQNFYSSDEMPVSVAQGATVTNGLLKDYSNIWFAGPVFTYRKPTRSRNGAFLGRAGFGFTGISDWGMLVTQANAYSLAGLSLGFLLEFGYDFSITKNLALGASLTLVTGSLRYYTEKTNGKVLEVSLNEEGAENLSHIGLSIGLRYNL